METTLKKCSRCNQEYPATTDYFYPNKDSKHGLSCYCKKCHNWKKKQSRLNNLWWNNWWWRKELKKHGIRQCTGCKRYKPNNNKYYGRTGTSTKFHAECKECKSKKCKHDTLLGVRATALKE